MVNISQRSFDYLLNQNGDLAQQNGRVSWISAYQDKLYALVDQIEMICPFPKRVLDIGSGLGGIDMLLIKRFACHCVMVDGEAEGPVMIRHNQPFCSRSAVDAFMGDNDIAADDYSYHNPNDLPLGPFDLVLSIRSWCFHYPPSRYLDFVVETTTKGALVLIDVRRERKWRKELGDKLIKVAELNHMRKFDRTVYERR